MCHCNSRDATGKFPDYPDIDEGGSEVIFKKKTLEVCYSICKNTIELSMF